MARTRPLHKPAEVYQVEVDQVSAAEPDYSGLSRDRVPQELLVIHSGRAQVFAQQSVGRLYKQCDMPIAVPTRVTNFVRVRVRVHVHADVPTCVPACVSPFQLEDVRSSRPSSPSCWL